MKIFCYFVHARTALALNLVAFVFLIASFVPPCFAQRAFDHPANEVYLRGSGAATTMTSISPLPDGSVIAGGFFTNFAGFTRASIVKISNTGLVDPSFNPVLQAPSFQLLSLQKVITDNSGNIFINGFFSSVNGVARDGIAKLLPSGALDSTWNASQTGRFLFRGTGGPTNPTEFIYLMSNNTITRIRLDNGQLDASFSPPATIFDISNAGQDSLGRIYIARLSSSGGQGYLFRLLPSGSIDGTWQPNANGAVHGLLIDPLNNGQSYFTGRFTQIGGIAKNGFVRLNENASVDTAWDPPGSFYPIEELVFDAATNFIYAANGPINRYSVLGNGVPDVNWNYDVGSGQECTRLVRVSIALSNNSLWVSGPVSNNGPKAMSRLLTGNGAIQNEYSASGVNLVPISKISAESDGFYLGFSCQIYKFNGAGTIELARPAFGNVLNMASDSSGNVAYEFVSSNYRQFPFSGLVGMQWSTGLNGPFPLGQTFGGGALGLLGNATFVCCGFPGLPGIQKRSFANGVVDPTWVNPPEARFKVTPFGVYTWGAGNVIQRRNLTTGALEFSIPVFSVTDVVIGLDGGGYAVGPSLAYNETASKSKIIKFSNTGIVDTNYPTFGTISSAGPVIAALDSQGNLFVAGDLANNTRNGVITKFLPTGLQDPNWAPRLLGTSGANSTNANIYQILIQGNRLIVLGLFNFANTLLREDLVAFPTSVFPTTTSIISHTPEPSAVNQPYNVSVLVTSPNGVPDELVTVSDGTGAVCNIFLSNGSGSCLLTSTSSGLKTLTASYRTTTVFAGSSATTTHSVSVPTPSTTVITSDEPDPSAVDAPYTVAVSVSSAGGTPTGTVAISDGGSSCNATLSGGSGSCVLISTTAGNKTLTASYPESAQFGASSDTEPHVVTGPITPSITLQINGSSSPPAVNPGRMGLALQFSFTGANPTSCQAGGTAGTTWPVTTFSAPIVSGSQSFFVRNSAAGAQTLSLSCVFAGFANAINAAITLPISGSATSGGVSLGSISAASALPNGVFQYLVPVSVVGVPSPSAFISQQPAGGSASIVQMTTTQLTLNFTPQPGQAARSIQALRIVAGNGSNGEEFSYVLVVPEPAPLFVNGFEGSAPVQANGASTAGRQSISGDGRYSVFSSVATNIVANDTNGVSDVFIFDLANRTTRRISVANGGGQSNGASTNAVISQDGRFIAYESAATNLVSGDSNGFSDIFLFDQLSNMVRRVSLDSLGQQTNQSSSMPGLSANGQFVSFGSTSTNLVTGDTNSVEDVFLTNVGTGSTSRISVSSTGIQGNAMSFCPCPVSADGDVIAFQSNASNLVLADSNSSRDIFVRRVSNGTTVRASVSATATEGAGESGNPAMSSDGRYVAFESVVPTLISGDTNGIRDVFRKDLQTGSVLRASVKNDGAQITTGESAAPSLSANGDAIGFFSFGTDLVAGDTNALRDSFVRVLSTNSTTRVSVGVGNVQSNGASIAFLSADATKIILVSAASNLVGGDTNGVDDAFVRNLQNGEIVRISAGTGN